MIFNGKQLTVFGHITGDFKDTTELTVEFTENGEQHIAAPEDTVFTAVHAKVNVPVGVDTADATATAEDMVQGKTAYVNGEKVTGNVADIRGESFGISIGDSEMVESEYGLNLAFDIDDEPAVFDNKTQFLLSAADIAKTAGLTADIIAEGNTVLGITGTFAGGGASDEDVEALNDVLDAINGEIVGETQYIVTFVDEDGTFLCEVPVYEGDNCDDPVKNKTIDAPAKGGTKYIGYRHSGWSKVSGGAADSTALQNVTANRTVYAAFEEYEITLASGDCSAYSSENVHWKINPDYVLTIYGNGTSIGSYYEESPHGDVTPWNDYQGQIVKVVIEEGIKNIGMYDFKGMTSLTEVVLPSSIRQIGNKAFEKCTSLKSITIPAAVKYINDHVFYDTPLESVVFERTSGWAHMENSLTGDGSVAVSASELQDPANAAALMLAYANRDWVNAEAA